MFRPSTRSFIDLGVPLYLQPPLLAANKYDPGGGGIANSIPKGTWPVASWCLVSAVTPYEHGIRGRGKGRGNDRRVAL